MNESAALKGARQFVSGTSTAHRLEALGFVAVLAVCVGVRLWHLGTVPRIILGDETANLQDAYTIIQGTGPGLFGFDWKPAPIFSVYPLAWTVEFFGNSVTAFRLFPVILSLLTIVMFYVVAREAMRARAALLGMLLLGTNLWFLHFSRTAWENTNSSLFALGACWCTQHAIQTGRYDWWVRSGVFAAFGLYGYFSGRFIFISVGMIAFLAIALRQAPWRRTLIGLGVAAIVSAVLFAPMALKIHDEWDRFNTRTKAVSIFETGPEGYAGYTNGWAIAAINLQRNFRGFILQDGNEFDRGIAAIYGPERRPPLDLLVGPLFLAGLVVGMWRWRKTYAWFTFFVPLAIPEVFSKETPDLARGIIIAPFYFLFIGLLFQEVIDRIEPPRTRIAMWLAAAALVAWVSVFNVYDYFSWQTSDATQNARLKGVEVCEFETWRQMALKAAEQRALVTLDRIDQLHRDNDCSTLLKRLPNSSSYIPPPTPTPMPTPGQ